MEIFKRYISRRAVGKRIVKVDYYDDAMLLTSKKHISQTLLDATFSNIHRHGKYVFLECGKGYLMFHFGMTGEPGYFHIEKDPPDYSRFVITFEDNHALACISRRKLGKIDIVKDITTFIKDHEIGEDAMSIDRESFRDVMSRKRGSIKNALMNQKTIAGLGNIYTDEILFQEKIHPKTPVSSLQDKSLGSLYTTMKNVCHTAIRGQAKLENMPEPTLLTRRSPGERCPVCDSPIQKITVNNRGTYFCPECQKNDE